MMNYSKIAKWDTANGPGIRMTVYVSGCSHQCPECHNPQTWDETEGKPFTQDTYKEILQHISQPFIDGITFSGGDPLYMRNRLPILSLIKRIRGHLPKKSIWLYTGYLWEEIKDLAVIQYLDVIVDGEYQKDKRDITLPYCGSSNQRVINVQESLKNNDVILWKESE